MKTEPRTLTGAEFRELRTAAGWHQSDVAKLLDVHPVHVSRWETGRRPLTRMASMSLLYAIDKHGPSRRSRKPKPRQEETVIIAEEHEWTPEQAERFAEPLPGLAGSVMVSTTAEKHVGATCLHDWRKAPQGRVCAVCGTPEETR